MSEEQFKEMINKLDTLIKITAANLFQDKPMSDSIIFLSNLGMANIEIASILGTTTNYVAVIKSKSKKPKRKKNEPGLKKEEGGKQT